MLVDGQSTMHKLSVTSWDSVQQYGMALILSLKVRVDSVPFWLLM